MIKLLALSFNVCTYPYMVTKFKADDSFGTHMGTVLCLNTFSTERISIVRSVTRTNFVGIMKMSRNTRKLLCDGSGVFN